MTDIKLINKGGFSNVYIDKKLITLFKHTYYLTLESMICLNIPNVLKIKSAKIEDNGLWYIYDYKEKNMKETNKLSTLHIEQLLFAITNLNNLNIVHVDIKPSNILFHKGDLYLSDLGGLRFLYEGDHIKNPSGTTYFISTPESIINKIFTKKSQTWSIGISLLFWATDYKNKNLIKYLNEINSKSNISIFENLIQNIIPDVKFVNIPIDTTEQCFREFIVECLVIDEKKRKLPLELITLPMISNNWSIKSPKLCYYLPIASQIIPIKNFNARLNVIKQILDHIDNPKINYIKFCIIIHLMFTTQIDVKTIINLSNEICEYGMYNIKDINTKYLMELENWQILPANSMYYSLKNKEHLQFFIAELVKTPACYLLLRPTNNFYNPNSPIDISEF